MSSKRSWKRLREVEKASQETLMGKVASGFDGVRGTPVMEALGDYLQNILLAVPTENELEAMLIDKGRKSLARDLLTMLEDNSDESDRTKNS